MLNNIGFVSYLSAALAYLLCALLMLTSWRRSYQGGLLILVVLTHIVWAASASYSAYYQHDYDTAYLIFEVLRYAAWYVFLLKLLQPESPVSESGKIFRKMLVGSVAFALLVLVADFSRRALTGYIPAVTAINVEFVLHIVLAIIGLAIIEQMYRNISDESRWALKFLILAAGITFVFDLFMYSDALLFRKISENLWDARGFVVILAVPLITIAAARSRKLSLEIFISRDVVLHTSAIMGGGIYLLLMSAIGYYLKEAGGKWGVTIQVLFLSLSVVLLVIILFSTQMQAKARVFVGKHFYKNKYDYRREWLQLNERLFYDVKDANQFGSCIRAIANIVGCQSGMLWLADERGKYYNRASMDHSVCHDIESGNGPLVRYLVNTNYIVNVKEITSHQVEYRGLVLPKWIEELEEPWLIVPLKHAGRLLGFIVLARPLVNKEINWEDRDLLRVAGQQIANYIAVILTGNELSQARQFEAFNRLAAYMVHDLKNVAAELELVVKNAGRHMSSQEFLHDAFDTVGNAARDIKRILDQLRGKQATSASRSMVDLRQLVTDVVTQMQDNEPSPTLVSVADHCRISIEKERLIVVLKHLIENAQQATTNVGHVHVSLESRDGLNIIRIEDDGCGMDQEFIRERLFKPFDTTKGNSGMGIGMYESREIIQANGGEIEVSSVPGKGTMVSLIFPASGPGRGDDTLSLNG